MTGKIDNIKIRMYNTGSVGDCLLLLFRKGETISFSMLIDCGGIKTSSAAVNPCVQDIINTCNSQLDLLIVTHQHEDHISGFNLARPLFDQITVKEVWMSWVEDKSDPVAVILKEKYGKQLKKLQEETTRAQATLKQFARQTSNVSGFRKRYDQHQTALDQAGATLEFEAGKSHGKGLAAGRLTNEDAMTYVKKKAKKISYRLPGEVVKDLPGAEGIKFYILGPPRDKDLSFLKIEMDDDEMYHLALNARADTNGAPPSQHITDSGISLVPKTSPFDRSSHMTGKAADKFWKDYRSEEMKWRQIETDWLGAGGGLALALTRFINNTSLAMALEFEGSGRVLLLPADAQSGNWMSWHKPEMVKSLKTKGGKDTNELLASTVFYKVGHHGSHNGTASHSGLDLVNNPGLVAFMPLIKDKVPTAWVPDGFPAEKLYKVLIGKTKGRIVRTDEGIITDGLARQQRKLLSDADATAFNQSFKKGSCYFEYTISGM